MSVRQIILFLAVYFVERLRRSSLVPGVLFDVHNTPWFVHFEYFDYESLGMMPMEQVMFGQACAIPGAPAFTWLHTASQR